ncbi:hypothetical protein Sjap_000729 [Stephania japonica]|uniref:Uncharacterized protein n=1 Tax=Stephania japonica TaxID=461633 RepID=A0AAP0PSU0_9MAGN
MSDLSLIKYRSMWVFKIPFYKVGEPDIGRLNLGSLNGLRLDSDADRRSR